MMNDFGGVHYMVSPKNITLAHFLDPVTFPLPPVPPFIPSMPFCYLEIPFYSIPIARFGERKTVFHGHPVSFELIYERISWF
jgi:hypothetical protein